MWQEGGEGGRQEGRDTCAVLSFKALSHVESAATTHETTVGHIWPQIAYIPSLVRQNTGENIGEDFERIFH